jgi:hypothetical protein
VLVSGCFLAEFAILTNPDVIVHDQSSSRIVTLEVIAALGVVVARDVVSLLMVVSLLLVVSLLMGCRS